jgi:hypothetical protein
MRKLRRMVAVAREESRSEEARYWNLLTDMRAENLQHGGL